MKNYYRFWMNILCNVYKAIRFWLVDKKIRIRASRTPLQVIIGAGGGFQKGWISTDITHVNMLITQDWKKYFKEESIDALFAEHVWEHLTEAEGVTAAENCYKYLKLDGYLRVAVPDGFHPSREYLDAVKPLGSGIGSDDHKVLFTHISITKLFEEAGFNVELLEYFDESGEFHYKEWFSASGFVTRSMKFDVRNRDSKLNYTSIILDAKKKRTCLDEPSSCYMHQ